MAAAAAVVLFCRCCVVVVAKLKMGRGVQRVQFFMHAPNRLEAIARVLS